MSGRSFARFDDASSFYLARIIFPMPLTTGTRSGRGTLSICVLGEFQIFKGKVQQDLPKSRKTRGLLAYLILSGRRHRRERLCDLFWDLPDDPRASLRWSLSRLRSLVEESGDERIVADREYVFFDPKGANVDLFEIRRELAGGANSLST